MMRSLLLCLAAGGLIALSACAEKEQTAATRKSDSKPWAASERSHVAGGWKSGDQASWEAQLRARAQAQNEYVRVK